MSSVIDHIVFCVTELDQAAQEVQRRFGLTSVAGGRHAGHGTANHIVPLGQAYLELVAVADGDEAASSPSASGLGSRASPALTPHALCLRTDELDIVCLRLGLQPIWMSRSKPDGTELGWRLAGLDAMVSRGLPFFIEWDIDPSDHPGSAGQGPDASLEASLTGEVELLAEWTSGSEGVSERSTRRSGPRNLGEKPPRLRDRSSLFARPSRDTGSRPPTRQPSGHRL